MRLLSSRHRHCPRPGPLFPPCSLPTSPASTQTPALPQSSAPAATPTSPAASTRRHPVLVDRSSDEEVRVWPVRYVRMLDMANDSHLFRTAAELDADGFYPVLGQPLEEEETNCTFRCTKGKMVQAFDHRAASIVSLQGNLFRPGQPDRTPNEDHCNPAFFPRPRYWVCRQDSEVTQSFNWFLAFKDITATTNVRTMIAAIVPLVGCGHTLPLLLPAEECFEGGSAACLLSNLNSIPFD